MVADLIGTSGLIHLDFVAEFSLSLVLLVLMFDFITNLVSLKGRK